MLDTARFSYFVAEKLGVPVGSVQTLTLGSHGDTMVPVPSACTVDGSRSRACSAEDDIGALVERTRNGGAEIVGLLKTGSASCCAPCGRRGPDGPRGRRGFRQGSAGVCLGGRANTASPGCTWASRRRSARQAFRSVVQRDLTDTELAALREAAEAVRAKQADVASL